MCLCTRVWYLPFMHLPHVRLPRVAGNSVINRCPKHPSPCSVGSPASGPLCGCAVGADLCGGCTGEAGLSPQAHGSFLGPPGHVLLDKVRPQSCAILLSAWLGCCEEEMRAAWKTASCDIQPQGTEHGGGPCNRHHQASQGRFGVLLGLPSAISVTLNSRDRGA